VSDPRQATAAFIKEAAGEEAVFPRSKRQGDKRTLSEGPATGAKLFEHTL